MTYPPNLMEVISRGSIEMYASEHEQQPPITRHRPQSSSSSSRHESQQSLESLPPDEPSPMTSSYTCLTLTTATSECSTDTFSDSMTDSSTVYARIHQLAETVKREVTTMRSGVEGEEKMGKESSDGCSEVKPVHGCCERKGHGIEGRNKKEVEESDSEMAAKVKRALAKMRHLDSRLADLSKKEKEVKRQRLALEQQTDSQSASRSSSTLLPVESMDCLTVFPTQPLYHSSSEIQCVEAQDSMVSEHTEEMDSKKERVKDHIDDSFIKRNIQLASDAGSIVAMTEDEKKRLEQLLTKSDEEEEEMSNKEEEGEATTHKMELIPVGFTFSEDDMERIRDIDSRLQNIVPALQWPADMYTVSQNDLTSEQNETVSDGEISLSTTTTTEAGPGEAVLQMLQTDREASYRLHQIEAMLNHLNANRDQQNMEQDLNPPHKIDRELLQELLKQCRDEQSASQLSQHAHYHE